MGRAFEYRRAAKEKRWDKMSKIFPKLAKAITVAAKQGGSDPMTNAKLRTAIDNAKAQNMPKENVQAAIKRASKKDSNLIEITYEGKAAHGVLILIECTTDNPTRTIANLKSYFNKSPNASIIPNGSLEFMFSHKSIFQFHKPDHADMQDIELFLIDYGLEELVEVENEIFLACGDYKNFGNLNQGFELLKIEIIKAGLQWIPISPIILNENQIIEIEKLLDRIQEDEDVQAIYTNIE